MGQISWDALIGIIGTLAGTILGWWLGRIGKVIINIKEECVEFSRDRGMQLNISFDEEPESVNIKFKATIFNRKGIPCSLNDVNVILEYQDEEVIIENDLFGSTDDNVFDKLLNINAYETVSISYDKGYTYLPHSEKMKRGYRIYLQYRMNGGWILYKKNIRRN